MPSLTLVEAAKMHQNPLIQGIIESVVTVNQFYRFLPFDQIDGNALQFNRENAIGGVAPIGIGGGSNAIPAGALTPATVTPVTVPLKALIGDALVDHFIETTMSGVNDQRGVQVMSKAKGLGREYQRQFILGDSVNPLEFDGLAKLVPVAQTQDQLSANYSFEILDQAISACKAKDGQVDFIMMPDEGLRKHLSLLRALGGAGVGEVVNLPGGGQQMYYRGIPMYRNDWIPVTGTTTKITDIYTGCLDDGSRKVGIAGLTPRTNSGIFVTNVGEAEGSNDTITRLRFYSSLAVFTELGIVRSKAVKIN